MTKVVDGLSQVERKHVDKLNSMNNYEDGFIDSSEWASLSICSIVAHLVECSDKQEVQACLDSLDTEPSRGELSTSHKKQTEQ